MPNEPTFLINLKLRNTYLKNERFYRWRKLPLIGKYIPNSLYGNHFLNNFFLTLGILKNSFFIFLRPLIYLIFIYLVTAFFTGGGALSQLFVYLELLEPKDLAIVSISETAKAYLHIIFCLSIIGAIFNNDFLDTNEECNYAILLLKMNPKKYAFSQLLSKCFTLSAVTLILLLFISIYTQLDLISILCISIIMYELKLIFSSLELYTTNLYLAHSRKRIRIQNIYMIAIALICLIFASFATRLYNILNFQFIIPTNSYPYIVVILFIPLLLAVRYLDSYNNYFTIFKQLIFERAGVALETNQDNVATNALQSKDLKRDIEKYGIAHTSSNKEGLAYFHEIFIKRHRTLLYKTIIYTSIIAAVAGIIGCLVVYFDKEIAIKVADFIRHNIMLFPFILYFINRGEAITRTMFINCDAAMLNIRFYRQPQTVLKLFMMRLKTIISLNMIPTLIIAFSLLGIAIISQMTILEIGSIFFSICFMGIFFSIHYLGMYYLLQPYTLGSNNFSGIYNIIRLVVYYVIYFASRTSIELNIAAPIMIIFNIIYIIVISILIYRCADKTFRLRNN